MAMKGRVVGSGMSSGIARGRSLLTVAPVRYIEDTHYRRRRHEDDLLIMEML